VSADLTELVESAIQLDAMMTRGHVHLHAVGKFHNAVSGLAVRTAFVEKQCPCRGHCRFPNPEGCRKAQKVGLILAALTEREELG
jgi:hypothetical protein